MDAACESYPLRTQIVLLSNPLQTEVGKQSMASVLEASRGCSKHLVVVHVGVAPSCGLRSVAIGDHSVVALGRWKIVFHFSV